MAVVENSGLSEITQLYFDVFEYRESTVDRQLFFQELEKFADLLEVLLQSCDWFKQKELEISPCGMVGVSINNI